jgi:protein SCO1/2/putative membrane protein
VFRLSIVLLTVSMVWIAGCSQPATALDDFGPLPDFRLVERSGQPISRPDLAGKTWIAAFIFTRCAGPCTQISGSMAQLQSRLSEVPDARLVSFSVDPEFDTPAILSSYAQRFGADANRWLFVTGDPKPVYELLRQGFKVGVEPTQGEERKPGNEVTHTTKLVLVDRDGHIRGYYDGVDQKSLDEIVNRVPRLARERPLQPAFNAFLNASSAVLVIIGYLAIRRRIIGLHKACMLTALTVSAIFLGSYLHYHFVVRHGEATRFLGTGLARTTYFTILLSHTLLAIAVAPMAIVTTYLGLRNRLARHVKLARWTLPLWLYVSITGVVVYWMLYQM